MKAKSKKGKRKTKDIREVAVNCDRCGKQHKVKVDFSELSKDQLNGRKPVLDNFTCPNLALMYRVTSFVLDTRVNSLKHDLPPEQLEREVQHYKAEWGEFDFNSKLERFKKLDLAFIGIPEEYYDLLMSVVSSYCCGYFYPAMTGAGSLGERILNRLIIKTREHFKSSRHYKKVWNKQSFEQWDFPVNVLTEWSIISDEVAKSFLELKTYRNDSIHYNDGYNFEKNSFSAIKAVANIVNGQFNYINRKDLFCVFNIPGEIWLKSAVKSDPFVIEFVLPHCAQLTPYCEPTANPPIRGDLIVLDPFSDEEFIKLRNGRIKKIKANQFNILL
jgi:hypothetical protein